MIPGEGAGFRLAYIDRKLRPGIFTLGSKTAPYYSTLLVPPVYGLDLVDRLLMEEKILPLFTGGTIFRNLVGDSVP
jgi:anaerobic ribonucleoside-triphosphate reductase